MNVSQVVLSAEDLGTMNMSPGYVLKVAGQQDGAPTTIHRVPEMPTGDTETMEAYVKSLIMENLVVPVSIATLVLEHSLKWRSYVWKRW